MLLSSCGIRCDLPWQGMGWGLSVARTSGRCPGYVIDQVKTLKEGGADEPWQSGEDAKAKNQWEYKAGRTMKERS